MKRLLSIFICTILVFSFSISIAFAGSFYSDTKDYQINNYSVEHNWNLQKADSGILDWANEDQAEDVDTLGEALVELTRATVKVWIFLATICVGIVGVIVALIKKKVAKKAVKAGAKAVNKTAQKSVKKDVTSGTSQGTDVKSSLAGEVGDNYVVTDPATGAQTLYVKDASGNWVSSDGNSILDTDKLSDWQKTRAEDRAWQDKSNENLNSPTKFEDIDRKEAIENEKIKRETYEEKIAIKHGMDTSDMDAVYQKVSSDMAREEVRGQKIQEHVEHVDTVINVTENIKNVADYSVSALGAVTGSAGKVVKDIYTAGTTIAEDVTTAVVEGKDVTQATASAVAKSAIGVIQNRVEGLGAKATANIVGGAASGGVDAYVSGEDVSQGIVKGVVSGTTSTVIDAGGEMVGALKDDSALSDLANDLVSSSSDAVGDMMKNATSNGLEKSFDKTFEELKPKK